MCVQNNLVLAIETSCDETAVSIVSDKRKILANYIYSQIEEHKVYGGVIPEFAARAHLDKLPIAVDYVMRKAQISFSDLKAVAATIGPGLVGGLHIGVCFAKSLAQSIGKQFIPVNHLEGHILTARLTNNIEYPYLSLLVSGGHCQIIEVKGFQNYHIIGQTLDDTPGELFDKIARILGGTGGIFIQELAIQGNPNKFSFPLSFFRNKDNANFSFSGLKTAISLMCKKIDLDQNKFDIAASLQKSVADSIMNRLEVALNLCSQKQLVISGGVAANLYLREQLNSFCSARNISVIMPPVSLCTDNAAMIAWVAIEKLLNNNSFNDLDIVVNPRLQL